MNSYSRKKENLTGYVCAFILLVLICFWLKNYRIESSWQQAGLLNLSVGALMLSAHIIGKIVKIIYLPLISGYILAGILAGPFMSGFLSTDMVGRLNLVNDLALSLIALSAGGSLHLELLRKRILPIAFNIIFQSIFIFFLVFTFIKYLNELFEFTKTISPAQMTAFGILLGVMAIARSPSSAIAIINECKAEGPFTDTVLSVIVAIDVLIIILFTIAMNISQMLLAPNVEFAHAVFAVLFAEITLSILGGALMGKGISLFIEYMKDEIPLPLCLFFLALGISRLSMAISLFAEKSLGLSIHLEPLLICMSAGFFVQNFTRSGFFFSDSLSKISLPIYVLFFCVTGASLNLDAFFETWPLAFCLAGMRMFGIFSGSCLAGILAGDPPKHNLTGWMGHITQAGVAIGLSQLVLRQFPEIGIYLSTVVLAVICVNQIVGPVAFKAALYITGEAKSD
ncbi:MAG: cation:proton antiporter [Desulfobacterales bacterium]